MFTIGPWEVVIVLTIALVLFGHRLPALARSLGRSVVGFRQGLRHLQEEVSDPAR